MAKEMRDGCPTVSCMLMGRLDQQDKSWLVKQSLIFGKLGAQRVEHLWQVEHIHDEVVECM